MPLPELYPLEKQKSKAARLITVVNKMGLVSHFSTNSQTDLIGKMTENANNKIPEYAIDYKREYLFIRGINKEFKYLINKLDDLNRGLFESNTVNRIKYIMKRSLRGQEKGKIKDISGFIIFLVILFLLMNRLNFINNVMMLFVMIVIMLVNILVVMMIVTMVMVSI